MTATVHLTDAQLAQFTACGLIVVDGEPTGRCGRCGEAERCRCPQSAWTAQIVAPELWRKLTEPCATCGGSGNTREVTWVPVRKPKQPIRYVSCPDCAGGRRVVTLTATCPCVAEPDRLPVQGCGGTGVVTLGRFTIRLLPVPAIGDCPGDSPHLCLNDAQATLVGADGEETIMKLDPLPEPGQFAVQLEPVAALTDNGAPVRLVDPKASPL